MPVSYTCLYCGKEHSCAPRQIARGGGKYCSRRCGVLANMKRGPERANFVGVKMINGYRYVYAPDHPHASKKGYVAEHRMVIEAKIGRCLEPGEQAHHVNKIRDDNRPENLILVNEHDHNALYHTDGQWLTCAKCGKLFWCIPSRVKKSKTGILACSHSCAAFLRSIEKLRSRLGM